MRSRLSGVRACFTRKGVALTEPFEAFRVLDEVERREQLVSGLNAQAGLAPSLPGAGSFPILGLGVASRRTGLEDHFQALVVAFLLLLRIGELLPATSVEGVQEEDSFLIVGSLRFMRLGAIVQVSSVDQVDAVQVAIRNSKANRGATRVIFFGKLNNPTWCPVNILWNRSRGKSWNTPIFEVSRKGFTRFCKSCAHMAGASDSEGVFSVHSLRKGGRDAYLRSGVDSSEVDVLGRWGRTSSTPYVRGHSSLITNAANQIVRMAVGSV